MKTQLAKWGNSLAIRIPKEVAAAARMQEGDGIELKTAGPGAIRIRAVKKKPTLAQFVRGITPRNRHTESDWGKPAGNELW
jgi:antitoxin MazE